MKINIPDGLLDRTAIKVDDFSRKVTLLGAS